MSEPKQGEIVYAAKNGVVVELRPRPPHLNHPDWVAFESVLRSLARLDRVPAETMAEALYGFASLGGHFTVEQILDEIEASVTELRVKIENYRASHSNMEER